MNESVAYRSGSASGDASQPADRSSMDGRRDACGMSLTSGLAVTAMERPADAAVARRDAQARLAMLALALAAMAAYALMLPQVSLDMQVYFLRWREALQQDGLAALGGSFADYTPPYLYLLWLTTPLPLAPVAAVKLVSIA